MKNKIFVGLAIIIIIGAIVIATLGFNLDGSYKNYNLVEVQIGQDFNISDVETITKEVFQNSKIEIEKAGIYSDYAIIKVNEINDEQKNLLSTKINEKYGTESTAEDVKVNYIAKVKILDIVKPYIVPAIITTVLVLVYMAVRFRKMGTVKVLSQTVILTIIAELLYFSIIAITRYPVNRLVMPVGMVVYVAILTALTGVFEKQSISIDEK